MTLFKIIDQNTGKEPTEKVITAQARLGNLMTCDIDGFYVDKDGHIILVDDCGNCTWLDMSRFKVEMAEDSVLDKIRAEIESQRKEVSNKNSENDKLQAYYYGLNDGLKDARDILDKHKAESEDEG